MIRLVVIAAALAAAPLSVAVPAVAQSADSRLTFTFETGAETGAVMVALYADEAAYESGAPSRAARVDVAAGERAAVFENLPAHMPRVVSVGRLDLDSEGLLLLTDDGALARRLELPSNGWLRRYRVRVYGMTDDARLAALAKGVEIDGVV